MKPAVHPWKLARRAECPKHPGCRQDKIHPAMMENKHFIFPRLLVCSQLFPCPWHVSQRLSTMGTGGAARSRRRGRQWEGERKAVPARWRFHVALRCTCFLPNRQPILPQMRSRTNAHLGDRQWLMLEWERKRKQGTSKGTVVPRVGAAWVTSVHQALLRLCGVWGGGATASPRHHCREGPKTPNVPQQPPEPEEMSV